MTEAQQDENVLARGGALCPFCVLILSTRKHKPLK